MKSTIERLLKILDLEVEQGYRNRAVIGGLERSAEHWEREMTSWPGETAAAAEQVAGLLRAYQGLDERAAREAHVERLRAALAKLAGAAAAAQPSPPRVPAEVDAQQPAAQDGDRQPARRVKPSRQAVERLGLDAPVTALSGVNVAYAEKFSRLGVSTIRDLLRLFPRRYDDFRCLKLINQLERGEEVTLIGMVWDVGVRKTRGGAPIVQVVVSDDSGVLQCTWFNQAYLADKFERGQQIVLSGRVEDYQGRLTLHNPEWEPLDKELLHTARIVPVYPLTEGIRNRWLRKLMSRTLDYWAPRLVDYMPARVLQETGLVDLGTAIRHIHFPADWDELERARRRLAFDELFLVQIGVLLHRHAWRSEAGRPLALDLAALGQFVASLPYALTGAQQRALDQVVADLQRDVPMNRLLQGDVGCGKTLVAAAAAWAASQAGAQVAVMAPTEILAEQHARTLAAIFGERPRPVVRLLTGSTPEAERQSIYAGLADGSIDVVVGTHALIQAGVAFHDLGLVVIDEQHRFGVQQRAALRQKGCLPHMLVMTATPIPRTLALTLYGDLDVSIIDEMPPGRQKIETHWLLPTERERAYNFIRAQVSKGRQAFIICPLVEESASLKAREQEVKAAVEEYRRLKQEVFPGLRLGLLHGRLKGAEKEDTMAKFVRGELDILVSTSVVEVGIDVPNASVMLVEGANRFGLSQLHQFRGRVGRGTEQAYCILLADSSGAASDERLQAIETIDDGFALAEKDLELRGPGEFFGTRQSGLPDLRLARLGDVKLLELARSQAQRLFEADPGLLAPGLRPLLERVARFWSGEGDVS